MGGGTELPSEAGNASEEFLSRKAAGREGEFALYVPQT